MSFRVIVATLPLVGMLLSAAPVLSEMSKEEITKAVGEAYGVTVLRVVAGEDDGRAVYLVTFMSPGGNFNEAFQVNSVAVDAETGMLIPQFRHRASGYRLAGAPAYSAVRQAPDAARKGFTWR